MCLLEKAWAKLHGSYLQIVSGQCDHVFLSLTNKPTQRIIHYDDENRKFDQESLWKKMSHASVNRFNMTTGTSKRPPYNGLKQDHVYVVCDAISVREKGREVRLVKIRDPHGLNIWEGDWSPNSLKWTPALRIKIGMRAGPGEFYMAFDDYQDQFFNTTICFTDKQVSTAS